MYTLKTKNKIQVRLEGIKIKRKKGSKEWKDQANKRSLRKATKKPKEELCFINDKENKKIKCAKIEEKLSREKNQKKKIKIAQEWLKHYIDECDE